MRADFNILDMSKHGNPAYWCRVQHRGVIKRKSFSFKRHGGKENALEAAKRWRDQMNTKLGAPVGRNGYTARRQYRIRTDKSGDSLDLPVGVTRQYDRGHNYADGIDRLYIVVNWRGHWEKDWPKTKPPRSRSTGFHCGPVDTVDPEVLRMAIRCACAFRKAYERALKRGTHFDDKKTMLRLRRELLRTKRQCRAKK